MDVCSYLVLHVRRGDKAAYASGHRCSYLRANCSSSKQQWRGAAGAGAKRGKGRRTSPAAAAADLFLEERTWLALRRVALAAPSLPWMVISDGKATAHAARQRLNNMTDGSVRFVSLSCNGSRPAAEGMAAMTAEVLLDFFAITRARGVIAIAPNSLHQGLAESSFATVAALAGDAPHLTPAPFGSADHRTERGRGGGGEGSSGGQHHPPAVNLPAPTSTTLAARLGVGWNICSGPQGNHLVLRTDPSTRDPGPQPDALCWPPTRQGGRGGAQGAKRSARATVPAPAVQEAYHT